MTADSPVIAEVVRNGFVESVHRGRVLVCAPDATRLLAVGDVDRLMLPRSCLKPMQTCALLHAGWQPTDTEMVAVAAASHSGEPAHLDVVRRILRAAGLDEDALQNTPDQPLDEQTRNARITAGTGPDRRSQNCSGKHAAMRATCVARGWPVEDYVDAAHPLQQAVIAAVRELAAESVDTVVVDGCGAPALALTMRGLVRAFAAAAASEVGAAMRRHPDLVGGTRRDVTRLMETIAGLTVKDGAEGVVVATLEDGTTVAVKVDDGAARARTPVLAAALARFGVDLSAVADLARPAVLGHGKPVGVVRAVLPIG